jgi:alkanesulfonate monooxygenase
VRELASKDGRSVKPAVRFNIIARQTPEEAWDVVRRAWAAVDWDAREKAQRNQRRGDGVGSWRTEVTRHTKVEDLVFEGLWAGFGTLGSQGSPLGFVGSYEQAAECIDSFIDMGVEGFILSSTPALEEAFHVGEEVLPLVRSRTSQSQSVQAGAGLYAARAEQRP